MTVLEYFDYEKRLLEDFNAVKTKHAKDAIYASLMKVFDEHRVFVLNTIRRFETDAKENAKKAVQIYKGETPDYVKNLMAEFGFYEPERCDDCCGPAGISHMKKDISHKLKSLCRTDGDDKVEKLAPPVSEKISDREYDRMNAKILSMNDPTSEKLGLRQDCAEMVTVDELLKKSSSVAVKTVGKDSKCKKRAGKSRKATAGK